MADDNMPNRPTQTSDLSQPKVQGDSQTASEYINSQLQLEAEAREALPYSFDHCTKPLGPLKQNIYSCLTCNPPPKNPEDSYNAAGICYGCSISCHGEHTLVELFAHRNFTCDCGTTRMPVESPCTLRINAATGIKESVHSEEASAGNTYNRNFRNLFCGCGEVYDAHRQKGTMYQCIGLATEQDGGCGEDWWHPECLKGWRRDWYLHGDRLVGTRTKVEDNEEEAKDDHPVPPGFPEDFASMICYKCVNVNPWIRKYVTSEGFMSLPYNPEAGTIQKDEAMTRSDNGASTAPVRPTVETSNQLSESGKKRKVEDEDSGSESVASKRAKTQGEDKASRDEPLHAKLPPGPTGSVSLLALDENFRSRFCRCPECYGELAKHPQLLEEEETYEPPVSEEGDPEGPASVGTGSLLERGEAALSNVDRVRAIEGVMVYNDLRDKVKSFLKPFAESGETVSAEHIKAYFEKLRGDDQAMKDAASAAAVPAGTGNGDSRREQGGY